MAPTDEGLAGARANRKEGREGGRVGKEGRIRKLGPGVLGEVWAGDHRGWEAMARVVSMLVVLAAVPCLATCLRLEVTSDVTSEAMAPVRQPMGATFPLRVRVRDPGQAIIKAGQGMVVTATLTNPDSWALTLLNTSVTFTPRSERRRKLSYFCYQTPHLLYYVHKIANQWEKIYLLMANK